MSTRTSLQKRFDELIKFGTKLKVETFPDFLPRKGRWQTSCLHLLEKTFGANSIYYMKFKEIISYADQSQLAWEIELMNGAKEEIERGILYKVEHLITADFFDSVSEQAEHLLESGFKDVAAILGRIVIESTMRDIAKRENISVPDKTKLSDLNQLLWKEEVYPKHMWRSIQAQIDVGNDAAHGHFDKYDEKSVSDMLTWIRETLLNL